MCLSTACIHLVSYVGFPPLASPQLLAFLLFQYPNCSCTPVPLSNFLHAFGFNIPASPVSQQLLALIWFQYLTSPPCASDQTSYTSCIHWVSISMLSRECSAPLLVTHWVSQPLPILPSSSPFPLFTLPAFQLGRGSAWRQPVWKCPTWGHSSGLKYLNFPRWCPSAISCIHSLGLKTSPLAS